MVGYGTALSSMAYPKQFSFFEDSKSRIKVEGFLTEVAIMFRPKILASSFLDPQSVEANFYKANALPSVLADPGLQRPINLAPTNSIQCVPLNSDIANF